MREIGSMPCHAVSGRLAAAIRIRNAVRHFAPFGISRRSAFRAVWYFTPFGSSHYSLLPPSSLLSPRLTVTHEIAAPAAHKAAAIHIARLKPVASGAPVSCSRPPRPAASGTTAVAMRPASRATALLTPDARPARE